jgi:DNA polymerase-3 subunit epsilon/ATP-dependent DNA helicase DinG
MQGLCPFYQARKAAEAAHVLVVNHALLLADIAAENHVLPPFNYLVLDEAHHLEAATTEGLSFELIQSDFERQAKELGGPNSGRLGEVLSAARDKLEMDRYVPLEAEAGHAHERASLALTLARAFFESVAAFLEERREGRPISDYGQSVRIIPATRALAEWSQVELQWDQFRPTIMALADSLTRIQGSLARWAKERELEFDAAEDLGTSVGLLTRYFLTVVMNVDGLVVKPDPLTIYWAEAWSRDGRIALRPCMWARWWRRICGWPSSRW